MNNFNISLQANDLAWSLPGGDVLFSGLDFSLGAGVTALVGPNGAGKSTLLAILAGRCEPMAGKASRRGNIGFLPQEARVDAADRVADLLGQGNRWDALQRLENGAPRETDVDILEGWWDLDERLQSALDDFGLAGLKPVDYASELSGGERTLCRLAGLLLAQPDILLLDEPTNHLDETARARLYAWLAKWQGPVLVASHDRELLERADMVVELSGGHLGTYGGNFSLYAAERERQAAAASVTLDQLRREKKQLAARAQESRERHERRAARGAKSRERGDMPKILLDARKGNSEASGARLRQVAEARMQAADSSIAAASARVIDRELLRIRPPTVHIPSSRRLVAFESVRLPVGESRYAREDRLDLVLQGPVRAWIRGPNGAGKTTLLDLVSGRRKPAAGRLAHYLAGEEIARLDQHATDLEAHRTLLDNFITMSGMTDATRARRVLADFLFRGESVRKPVAVLSGGERMRAALACVLYRKTPPQLLCLDEPTNHLDLESVESVERALAEWRGAMIVVTHDAHFAASLEPDLEICL